MTGHVVFEDGVRGEVWPELLASEEGAPRTRVRLEDGRQVLVPTGLLVPQADGICAVPLRTADFPHPLENELPLESPVVLEDKVVVPVIEEIAHIGKRMVETGRVRVTKAVTEREEVVDEPLTRTTAEVERVPVGRLVDTVPEIRQEGDTLIISVVEEVLVVEKRLMLVEEVRVTQRQSEHHAPQTVTLRREEVSIEHTIAGDN